MLTVGVNQARGNSAIRLATRKDLDELGDAGKQQERRRDVMFAGSPKSAKAITPYSVVYGRHPTHFEFDRQGRMKLTPDGVDAEAEGYEPCSPHAGAFSVTAIVEPGKVSAVVEGAEAECPPRGSRVRPSPPAEGVADGKGPAAAAPAAAEKAAGSRRPRKRPPGDFGDLPEVSPASSPRS